MSLTHRKNALRNRRKNACIKKRPAQLYRKRHQKFTRIPVYCCCNNSTRLNSLEMLTGPLTGVGAVIRFAGLNIEYWGKGHWPSENAAPITFDFSIPFFAGGGS